MHMTSAVILLQQEKEENSTYCSCAIQFSQFEKNVNPIDCKTTAANRCYRALRAGDEEVPVRPPEAARYRERAEWEEFPAGAVSKPGTGRRET